ARAVRHGEPHHAGGGQPAPGGGTRRRERIHRDLPAIPRPWPAIGRVAFVKGKTMHPDMHEIGCLHTDAYLRLIGVRDLPPMTSPFDPGYDPVTLESHLDQSAHLMSILKISMACWMVAREHAVRRKVADARRHGVPTVTGGGPFEVAVAQGALPAY